MANNYSMHAIKHKTSILSSSISQNLAKGLANVTLGRSKPNNDWQSCTTLIADVLNSFIKSSLQ